MSKAQHAPGPWKSEGRLVYRPGDNGSMICELSEPRATTYVAHRALEIDSKDADEAYANGRLIAASPALLKAAEEALSVLAGLSAIVVSDPGHDISVAASAEYARRQLVEAITEAKRK